MSLTIVPLHPIDRGQLHVMRVNAAVTAIVLIVPAIIAEFALADRIPVRGAIAGAAVLLGLWIAVFAPSRRWRHWGYAFTGRELHVGRGWWTRVHTIVPVLRVQHIDVAQGPLERSFGVARLILHTAGTDDTTVTLPGITRGTAEGIRDAIRERIGSAA
jgi:membrane protein YdbS with pleckstrin-like domain